MDSMYTTDKRIVMTLDAGGTNLVFSAMQGGVEVVEPVGFVPLKSLIL